ncbi:MAG: rRNA maturation RNase YbeY [Spirochaetaceae bacterium]|nr:MAG: rRNA maturation RNase YbeY [Spirochaetaceae bacterium]
MREVDVSADEVDPPPWIPDFAQVAQTVFTGLGIDSWDVRVLLCRPDRIRDLNREFRDKDAATDVLTFDDHDDITGGDIAICPDIVSENATSFHASPAEECLRVYVHALLHLCGYTHSGVSLDSTGATHHPMFEIQERIVASLAHSGGADEKERLC